MRVRRLGLGRLSFKFSHTFHVQQGSHIWLQPRVTSRGRDRLLPSKTDKLWACRNQNYVSEDGSKTQKCHSRLAIRTVFCVPAEPLSDVLPCVIKSGLHNGNRCFAARTGAGVGWSPATNSEGGGWEEGGEAFRGREPLAGVS